MFEGWSFGATITASGEVVFSTSMTGYQEMLTDPSFAGQIVVPTYPLIGNYGINAQDSESAKIRVSGFVVREHCDQPSHAKADMTVDEYLRSENIPGVSGIDTRALTRRRIFSTWILSAAVATTTTTTRLRRREEQSRRRRPPTRSFGRH